MHKPTLIYIMGAGRSGTTALATFLGNSREIQNIGEMHQFFDYLNKNKECSCGTLFTECKFWNEKLSPELLNSSFKNRVLSEKMESHSSIIKHLFKLFTKQELEQYSSIHFKILEQISINNDKKIILDSSKYIGRALSLNNLKDFDLKVIYVVRDVRGVINSFLKKVQTTKHPLNTILYYLIVNSAASFIATFILKRKVIKIKYEDLVDKPIFLFERLENFLKLDLTDVKSNIKNKKLFEIGHIVGGNRIRSNKNIYLKKDAMWMENFNLIERSIYYILAAPIMIINRYKL